MKNIYEIPKILEKNEEIVYETKPEYKPYIFSAIIKTIIAIPFIGIFILHEFPKFFSLFVSILFGVFFWIIIFTVGIILANMAYARTHYAITNKRVIIQTGIIGRDFKSIDLDKIQNSSVDVGIIGVIFKVGNVQIFTGEMEGYGGRYSTTIRPKYDVLGNVKSPYEVLRILQEQISKKKEKWSINI